MDTQEIHYALAKQVPDIAGRGCTIGTSYGAIDIPPGWLADAMVRALTRALQCEILYQERARHHVAGAAPEQEDNHGH
jgi:hypothetical protein